jgi:hypothetical protein
VPSARWARSFLQVGSEVIGPQHSDIGQALSAERDRSASLAQPDFHMFT